jgi:hypothetical protein
LRLSGTVTAASVVVTGASGRKAFMHLQPGLPGFLLDATFGAAKLRVGGLRRDGYGVRRAAARCYRISCAGRPRDPGTP